jgi:hypothetical protein
LLTWSTSQGQIHVPWIMCMIPAPPLFQIVVPPRHLHHRTSPLHLHRSPLTPHFGLLALSHLLHLVWAAHVVFAHFI